MPVRTEVCHRYRPKRLRDVIGQPAATKVLTRYVRQNKVPHAILFTGPSGVGKTTYARIMKDELRCNDRDYQELNAANYRGIDMVRDIQKYIGMAPMLGKTRVWVIDEAHQLTKPAQDAILKVLEEPPLHAYIMLCTTEPGKLKKTVTGRCTRINLNPIHAIDLENLIRSICKKEGVRVPRSIIYKIREHAQGSARQALVILDKVLIQETKKDMLAAIEAVDYEGQAFELVKTMIPFKGKPSWSSVSAVLEKLKDEDPEGMRQLILKVCRTHMLKGGFMGPLAWRVYQAFRDNYYDTGYTGLVASAYEVVHLK